MSYGPVPEGRVRRESVPGRVPWPAAGPSRTKIKLKLSGIALELHERGIRIA
jgi:hypothetical protein